MTAFDYTNMAVTATRLLTRFGSPLILRRTTPGTYDPTTGSETGDTTDDLATIGVLTKITTGYALANEVQNGDQMAILDASQAPQMPDQLVVGEAIWNVVKINPVNPAGTPVVYLVQVRQ